MHNSSNIFYQLSYLKLNHWTNKTIILCFLYNFKIWHSFSPPVSYVQNGFFLTCQTTLKSELWNFIDNINRASHPLCYTRTIYIGRPRAYVLHDGNIVHKVKRLRITFSGSITLSMFQFLGTSCSQRTSTVTSQRQPGTQLSSNW